MKVEIEIKEGQLGDTVVEVFKNLTEDQRKELAGKVMKEWLCDPASFERSILEKKAIAECRNHWNRDKSEDEIRSSYEFKEKFRVAKTSRDIMIEQITEKIIAHYKEEVTAVIKTDPNVQAMLEEVKKQVREELPKAAHDAIVVFFSSHMQQITQEIFNATMQSSAAAVSAAQLSQKLKELAVH